MFEWTALLLPALLATGLVFVASSIIHMVIQWHAPDYRKFANEDEVRAVIRRANATPGEYVLPHCKGGKDMADPAMLKKFEEGPLGTVYLRPNGPVKLGPFLGAWIVYTFVVSLIVGYLGWACLPRGAEYSKVFQVLGAAAWLAYAWGSPADSIWKGKPWSATFRYLVDGLVYACLTAGSFAWLWPR